MKLFLSDKVYNILKWVVILVLPAISSFYNELGTTWGLPYTSKIVSTITAVTALFGAILGIGSIQYKKFKDTTNNK